MFINLVVIQKVYSIYRFNINDNDDNDNGFNDDGDNNNQEGSPSTENYISVINPDIYSYTSERIIDINRLR
ncbi:hypothetical protein H8356DRAFT_1335424 [Neocallimastix lanati (nom. inval.)]|nr:hypothetical protein H8356DRAFT_1335424 [Neocallimastix sp. JGI-2020a]